MSDSPRPAWKMLFDDARVELCRVARRYRRLAGGRRPKGSGRPLDARRGRCVFCGHPEALHRGVEAITDSIISGEARDDVLADYGWSTSEFLAVSATVAAALMGTEAGE